MNGSNAALALDFHAAGLPAGLLGALGPIVIVFIFAVLGMVLPFTPGLQKAANRQGMTAFTAIGLGAALLDTLILAGRKDLPYLGYDLVVVDGYSLFVGGVILLGGIFAVMLGAEHFEQIEVRIPETAPLMLFAVMGMLLMAVSADLIMLFVALEVMSIALYALTGLNRGHWPSAEAAFKYLILGAFSSAILLYGIAFIFGAAHSTQIREIAAALHSGHGIGEDPMMAIGFAMLLVGFAFKVGAAPFHMWSPDVYQGAPSPITAFMSTGVKAATFAAMGRVFYTAFGGDVGSWSMAVWVLSALTIAVGNIAALSQTDLKRMLAYSSIAHAGYLLMGIVSLPPGGFVHDQPVAGLLFYLLTYTLMNFGAFALVSMMTRGGEDQTRIENLRGMGRRHPLVAAAMAVCLLSLAGIPPTMGFVGKFYLFSAAVQGGFYGLAVVGALGGAVGVYYYLRPIVVMFMLPEEGEAFEPAFNRPALATLGFAALALLALGLMPGWLVDLARDSMVGLAG